MRTAFGFGASGASPPRPCGNSDDRQRGFTTKSFAQALAFLLRGVDLIDVRVERSGDVVFVFGDGATDAAREYRMTRNELQERISDAEREHRERLRARSES